MSKTSQLKKLKAQIRQLESRERGKVDFERREKDSDVKIEKQINSLEAQKLEQKRKNDEAIKNKGFFGRVVTGFRGKVTDYSIRSQQAELRGITRAKVQTQLYTERAKALEQQHKLKELKMKNNISIENLIGIAPTKKEYKPISFSDIGIKV